jgi:antitoxin HicB
MSAFSDGCRRTAVPLRVWGYFLLLFLEPADYGTRFANNHVGMTHARVAAGEVLRRAPGVDRHHCAGDVLRPVAEQKRDRAGDVADLGQPAWRAATRQGNQALARRINFGTLRRERHRDMKKKKGRIGSSFDDFLKEEGIYEEVTAHAIKHVIAHQLDALMREQGLTKSELAKRMDTSRAQLDRLLDPDNESVTLATLTRAAQAVGRHLRIELV